MPSVSLLSLLLFFTLNKILQATVTTVYDLTYDNSTNLINLRLGSQLTSVNLAIDTSIPFSLINSINCSICYNTNGNNYNTQLSSDSQLLSSNSSYKKLKHEYTGDEYNDSFDIKDSTGLSSVNGHLTFISTINVSLTSCVYNTGSLSLSYFSDFIKAQSKRLFILSFIDDKGSITFGDLNPESINITQLKYYPITINEQDKQWYLTSNKLTIKRSGQDNKEYKDQQQRVMIDTNQWQFYIPRKFFFDNLEAIFPMQCQINRNDIFSCICYKESDTLLFPTFTFTIGGNEISMGPKQYLSFSQENNYCFLYLSINYYSDFWVIGLNLLNEHNTIFDYENNRIAFYDTVIVIKESQTGMFITVFLSVAILSSLLFFGGYCLYKKYHPILNQ